MSCLLSEAERDSVVCRWGTCSALESFESPHVQRHGEVIPGLGMPHRQNPKRAPAGRYLTEVYKIS
jgi:hypothetical protein